MLGIRYSLNSYTFYIYAAITLVFSISPIANAGGVIYVNAALHGGDGTSWETAYQFLQDGLADANNGSEVWVAAGTYWPDQGSGQTSGNQDAVFALPSGVALLGGFAGDEKNAGDRDPLANETILSGDIGVADDDSDNSVRVVLGESVDNSTVLDGFVITGGRAFFNSGGGVRIGGDPLLSNLRFIDNATVDWGGGLYATGSPTVVDCTFTSNTANDRGGGAWISNGIVSGCIFENNFVPDNETGNASGAGLFCGSGTIVIDSIFEENVSQRGGGLSNLGNITIDNCMFIGNTASARGGGMFAFGNPANTTLINCTFIGNTGALGAGGVHNERGGPTTIIGCLFLGNSSAIGGALHERSLASITNCIFSGNTSSGPGGAIWKWGQAAVITNCTFASNSSLSEGGGISSSADITLANSILWDNDVDGAHDELAQINVSETLTMNYNCVQGLTGNLGGVGNTGMDPMFIDPAGLDGIVGTEDDDLRIPSGSPCVDSADNLAVPADEFDFDDDGNTSEPLPFDLDGLARFSDDIKTKDSGNGTAPIVDMGAYEFDGGLPGGTFTGPKGGSWFDPNNWQSGSVPDSSTDVFIGTTAVIDQEGAVANSITVFDGGTLNISIGSLSTPIIFLEPGATLAMTDSAAFVLVHSLTVQIGSTVQWDAGTIQLSKGGMWNNFTSPIEIGCSGNGSLIVESGSSVLAPIINICDMGEINGTGTLIADIFNSGQIRPGFSPGELTIDGSYTQTSTGSLVIEAAGYEPVSEHDLFTVNGEATLSGTLTVLILPGFEPLLTPARFLTADAVSDAFTSVELPDLDGGFQLAVHQTEVAVSLLAVPPGPRIFVDASVLSPGDGTTWEFATNDLATALAAASQSGGIITEVWVAAGTYLPDSGTNDRTLSFELTSDLAVYGGFAGGETELDQRDYQVNITVLSGDLNNDDGPSFLNAEENSYHVITGNAISNTAVLDGFTIKGGNANGSGIHSDGGAMHAIAGTPTIVNCTFVTNRAEDKGGAVYSENGDTIFTNCIFSENFSQGNGGAIFNLQGIHSITDCEFNNNIGNRGAALYNDIDSDAIIASCVFSANEAIEDGGAVYNSFCSPSYTDCEFDGNSTSSFSGEDGGAMVNAHAHPVVTNCDFLNNTAKMAGGAIRNITSTAVFNNCTFNGNSASSAGAVRNTNASSPTFTECTFENNHSDTLGGGMQSNGNSTPTLIGCSFLGNTADQQGGGLFALNADTALIDCIFTGNVAGEQGGGLFMRRSAVTLQGGSFNANVAPAGSGIFNLVGDLLGGTSLLGGDELLNGGYLFPGLQDSPFTIEGAYRQEHTPDFVFRIPRLFIELAGTEPGVDFGVLQTDTAELFGSVFIDLVDDFMPNPGDQFQIVQANSVTSPFDVAYFPTLPEDLRLTVDNIPDTGVIIGFEEEADEITFEDAFNSTPASPLRKTIKGDFDNDGDPDIILLLNPDVGNGQIVVLRNLGNDGEGNWLGFEELPPFETSGENPAQLEVGFLNNDQWLDIAVVDATLTTVTTYINTADGSAQFKPGPVTDVGQQLNRISAGVITGSGLHDLVVGLYYPSTTSLYLKNDGTGAFTTEQTFIFESFILKLADVDNDTDLDLLGPGLVSLFDSDLGVFLPPQSYEIDQGGDDLLAVDLNNDGWLDLAFVSRLAETLSILVNRGTGNGEFDIVAVLPLGNGPSSVNSIDAENDGDQDILVVLRPYNDLQPSVILIRNDLNGGETIILSSVITVTEEGDPKFAFGADLNGDLLEDLIIVGTSSGGGGYAAIGQTGNISAKLTSVGTPCPADLNGDGNVGTADLLALFAQWGTAGPADFNGDGTVNTSDLLILFANWGPCA